MVVAHGCYCYRCCCYGAVAMGTVAMGAVNIALLLYNVCTSCNTHCIQYIHNTCSGDLYVTSHPPTKHTRLPSIHITLARMFPPTHIHTHCNVYINIHTNLIPRPLSLLPHGLGMTGLHTNPHTCLNIEHTRVLASHRE